MTAQIGLAYVEPQGRRYILHWLRPYALSEDPPYWLKSPDEVHTLLPGDGCGFTFLITSREVAERKRLFQEEVARRCRVARGSIESHRRYQPFSINPYDEEDAQALKETKILSENY